MQTRHRMHRITCALAEICGSSSYTAPTDIWSLGVILHEMMALNHPFTGTNIAQLVAQIVQRAPAALPAGALKYTDPLKKLRLHMLNKSPNDRPTAASILKSKWGQVDVPLSAALFMSLACPL